MCIFWLFHQLKFFQSSRTFCGSYWPMSFDVKQKFLPCDGAALASSFGSSFSSMENSPLQNSSSSYFSTSIFNRLFLISILPIEANIINFKQCFIFQKDLILENMNFCISTLDLGFQHCIVLKLFFILNLL